MVELMFKKVYYRIYLHQNKRCFYCDMEVDYRLMQKEHVYPRSKGGSGIINKVLACKDCNKWKADYLIEDFKKDACRRLRKCLTKDNVQGLEFYQLQPASQKLITRYKNIIKMCDYLLSGGLVREGWHTKAFYISLNQCEKPIKHGSLKVML